MQHESVQVRVPQVSVGTDNVAAVIDSEDVGEPTGIGYVELVVVALDQGESVQRAAGSSW